jgi:hypothetical protein
MALGATWGGLKSVFRRGLSLVGLGLAIGIVVVAQFIQSVLYGVTA